jgi:hypothetical protein
MASAEFVGPSLWSSDQSSWLQIQRSWFDSRRYKIFWEIVGLERGPLSLVNTIEELLERKSSGSGLESREYGRRDPSRRPRITLYPQRLALTSPTSGGLSFSIVRSRTQAAELNSDGDRQNGWNIAPVSSGWNLNIVVTNDPPFTDLFSRIRLHCDTLPSNISASCSNLSTGSLGQSWGHSG